MEAPAGAKENLGCEAQAEVTDRTITGFEVQLALAPIVCKDRDGKKRTFYYAIEDSGPDVIFRVHKSDPPENEDDFFELKLTRCSNGMYRIENIIGHSSDYRAVGIPDALIPEASSVLKAAIRSSPKLDTSDGSTWRTDGADTMRRRLRQNGIARYITDEDYFVVELPAPRRELTQVIMVLCDLSVTCRRLNTRTRLEMH